MSFVWHRHQKCLGVGVGVVVGAVDVEVLAIASDALVLNRAIAVVAADELVAIALAFDCCYLDLDHGVEVAGDGSPGSQTPRARALKQVGN